MKPLVSILIPAHNAEEWIADTVESAIAQTWPRKEIILVDDGSRDRTAEVVRRFASKEVAVVSIQNQGAAAARNHALQLSQGDYIQWLDADDLLAPDKIETQLRALGEVDGRRILLSSPWAPFYYRTHRARFIHNSLCQDLSPVEWLLRKMGENLHMQTATWLTCRELAEAAGPWDTRLLSDDDGEYFCRVLLAAEGTRFVPDTGVFYRVTGSSRLSFVGASDKKKDALILAMKLHIQYLRSLEDSERVRKVCLTYMQTWYENFYPERPDLVAELQALAAQLQGHLKAPRLRWKYAWMKPIFGWKAAKWAQRALPQLKAFSFRHYDKAIYRLEAGRTLAPPGRWRIVGQRSNETLGRRGADFTEARNEGSQSPGGLIDSAGLRAEHGISVALLTGGSDKPYVFGLATSLMSKRAALDLIASDELDCPEFHDKPGVNFLNLRGSQRQDASFARKVFRVSGYYAKLIRYAAIAKPQIFHILWNNRFESFDRTLLMVYYKLLGKKIVLTAHNVNADRRDCKDTSLNRLTLRIQYRLADHIFVHTEKMKRELSEVFGVQPARVTVIPFGINNAVPNTRLTASDAKRRLGVRERDRMILFFGRVTPYKGLEYLIAAFREVLTRCEDYRLIIAGRPDNCEGYWREVREAIAADVQRGRVLLRADFVPDDETEVYFKASDVLVLPYKDIYQSGVLFLGHSFGLPVLAADVGSLKDEIVEGKTGFVFRPGDPVDLASTIERYFASDLYANLNSRRPEIRDYATKRHSWDVVGRATMSVYAGLLRMPSPEESLNRDELSASLDVEPF